MAEPLRVPRPAGGEHGDGVDAVEEPRRWVARAFTRVEDVVYVGLGILLAASALVLLVAGFVDFGRALIGGTLVDQIVNLLDRVLLTLILVELLYTLQVSFREHALVPEPFLVVGLIAAIRRVLVLTAEVKQLAEQGDEAFRNAMVELGLLTALILAMVVSLMLLRRRERQATADRA